MTGPNLKEELETLVNAAYAHMLDLNETDLYLPDLPETISVLQEILPGTSEVQLRKALETEDGYSLEELEKMASDLETTATDRDWEIKGAKLLEAFIVNLNQNGELDLNPSYHYHE